MERDEAEINGIVFEGGANQSLNQSSKKLELVYFHNSLKSPIKVG
jgi:hypothetical protein